MLFRSRNFQRRLVESGMKLKAFPLGKIIDIDHAEDLIKAQCKAKKVLFTHVWSLDKYSDINAAKGSYPFEILTPNDGDTFEI